MKTDSIVILHGWWVPSTRYEGLKKEFEKYGYKVYIPDFPGFDGQKVPKTGYMLSDYARFFEQYLKEKNIKNVFVVAHSFGGRVTVKYLAQYGNRSQVKAVIFCGTPLVKDKLTPRKLLSLGFIAQMRNVERRLPIKVSTFLRERFRFIIYRLLGEYDYYKAGDLQSTLVNILNDDPEKYLSKVHVPVLIIWGADDTITPVSIALGLHNKIKSDLVIVDRATHKLPYQKSEIFAKHADSFFKKIHE